jgi:SAM-dependent methyltransferase
MHRELVCPRDHKSLSRCGDFLVCNAGHQYPIRGGIPIFILDEAEQTHDEALRALQQSATDLELMHDDGRTRPKEELHPVVRDVLGATSGFMYEAIKYSIDHYPIPSLRIAPTCRGDTFLDIGCNWGRWSIAAAKAGYSVTGIDPSFGALVVAKYVFRQFGLQARFVCADARYLPFRNDSFDTTFSYSVIQHFSKLNARYALSEIARVTRRSSLIQMPNKFGLRSMYHRIKRFGSLPLQFEVRYWSPEELLSVFTEAIGPSHLSIDGFFGLGMQASDLRSFLPTHRALVRTSEWLRKYDTLTLFADSLYVHSLVQKEA